MVRPSLAGTVAGCAIHSPMHWMPRDLQASTCRAALVCIATSCLLAALFDSVRCLAAGFFCWPGLTVFCRIALQSEHLHCKCLRLRVRYVRSIWQRRLGQSHVGTLLGDGFQFFTKGLAQLRHFCSLGPSLRELGNLDCLVLLDDLKFLAELRARLLQAANGQVGSAHALS